MRQLGTSAGIIHPRAALARGREALISAVRGEDPRYMDLANANRRDIVNANQFLRVAEIDSIETAESATDPKTKEST